MKQVSERLRQLNFDIIKPKQSFLKHEDDNKSVMHPNHRFKNPINSYNFLDNE